MKRERSYQELRIEVFRFTKEDLLTVSTNGFETPFREDTKISE